MHPELVTTFIDEFHREVNRQSAEQGGTCRTARELEKTEHEIRRVIEAIKAGVPGVAVKDEMADLETRQNRSPWSVRKRTASHAATAPEPCRGIPSKGHEPGRGA